MSEFVAGFLSSICIFAIFRFFRKNTKRDLSNVNNEVDLRQIIEKTIYSIQEANKNSPRQRVKVFFGMVLSSRQNLEEKSNFGIQVSKILQAGIDSEIHTEIINKTENYIQFSVEIAVGKDIYHGNMETVNFGMDMKDWF